MPMPRCQIPILIVAGFSSRLPRYSTPREVLYDNMRTVVLERHGYGRGRRSGPPAPAPIIGLQHPLSFYDAFAGGLR